MNYKDVKPSFNQKFYQALKLFYRLARRADEMDQYFRVEKFSKTLHPLHFRQEGVGFKERRHFFTEQLIGVELETHAYCNRTCSFCPNSFLDRRNKGQLMPEDMFLKIIDELAAIEFTGDLRLQRYNEPLANEIIYERVAQARLRLPKADLSFHSNGDYVTMDRLSRLEKAGLNNVFVSLYPDYEKYKDNLEQAGNELCQAFLKRVGVQAKPVAIKNSLGRYKFNVEKMNITIFAFNLHDYGTDRGGSLPDLTTQIRRSPCMSPFSRLYIDWNGDVFPCCNLRTDYPGHKSYIMGNAGQQSLMDIYYSHTANFMRRHLVGVGEKTGACRSCTFDLMCSNQQAKNLLDKTLKKIDALNK